jgi:HTH-type transcriptional regulator/antitoxin HigA
MTTGLTNLVVTHRTYQDLLLAFLPRTIRNEAEFATVQREIDRLIDQDDLSPDEQEYLDLLGTLVWAYEEQQENRVAYELRGVELVRGLLELHNLRLKDLTPLFKTKSIASAVLNGKRRLTVEQINRLAAFFRLPHGLFFSDEEMFGQKDTTRPVDVDTQ